MSLETQKSGKISPAAKNNNVLFHAEHLFLFIPHQGHCLLELLDAYVLFKVPAMIAWMISGESKVKRMMRET